MVRRISTSRRCLSNSALVEGELGAKLLHTFASSLRALLLQEGKEEEQRKTKLARDLGSKPGRVEVGVFEAKRPGL